jgi:DNA invertase Pin-like site-specific DNA recombinase
MTITGQNIGYIRVSTTEQNTSRQIYGIEIHRTFIDKCSGKDTHRPELNTMLEFVRDGDCVYIHSMDRLARNLLDLKNIVLNLTQKGVKVIFVKENLSFDNDSKNPLSNLLLNIMGAFAEFERELIKERQKEGIIQAKKQGKYNGRKQSLSPEQIIEVKQLVLSRYKITEIAKQYQVSRSTIYNILGSEKKSLP